MRLRQLEYFIAVAEAGSMTQAAAELYVAQPSLSQQMIALERELGGELLERLPRGVRLTPVGRAFLVEARAAVDAAGRAQEAVRAVSHGRRGEIRLATITSLAIGLVPSIASTWHQDHPEVAIRLTEHGHPDLLEDVVRIGDADLGVGPEPHGQMAEVHALGAEEFVFVLRENDPLAGRARIDPRDLADREWVLFEKSHGIAGLVRRMCSLWGFTPMAAMRTSQTEAAVRLAAAGLGPTVVPSNVIAAHVPGIVVRPVIRPVLRRLTAYSRGPMGPLEAVFLKTVLADAQVREMAHVGDAEDAVFL